MTTEFINEKSPPLVSKQRRPSHNTLASIFEESDDCFVLVNTDLEYTTFNSAWKNHVFKLFGRFPQAGMPVLSPLQNNPEKYEKNKDYWMRALNGERLTITETFNSNNLIQAYESKYYAHYDDNNNIIGAVCLSRNVTPRYELNRKLEQFISKMCHELRNPLHGVSGTTQSNNMVLLNLETFLNANQDRTVTEVKTDLNKFISELKDNNQTIEECTSHQIIVSDDVLKLSKLDANKFDLTLKPLNVQKIIQTALRMQMSLILKKRIKVNCVLPKEDILAKGDAQQLRQILLNLISNAIKFTPTNGEITLALETLSENSTSKTLKISVTDSGIGMSQEEIQSLFEPFSQANGNISSQYGGSGLGLSISKSLVELMSGNINVTSKPNEGSCFSFTVVCPTLSSEEEKQCQDQPIIADGNGPQSPSLTPSKVNILIVEDNIINQKVLTNFLKQDGFPFEIANNGEEALNKYFESSQNEFSIILMDVGMPGLDGYETTQKIREYENRLSLKNIPIICTSGFVTAEDKKRALNSGMNACISKPFKKEELLNTISSQLSGTADERKRATVESTGTKLLY